MRKGKMVFCEPNDFCSELRTEGILHIALWVYMSIFYAYICLLYSKKVQEMAQGRKLFTREIREAFPKGEKVDKGKVKRKQWRGTLLERRTFYMHTVKYRNKL